MRTLVCLVLAACASQSKNAPTSETACSKDADCVVVETKCCDHCNGGAALAFNKASASAHEPKGCDGVVCDQTGCGEATARCDKGQCKVTIEPLTHP